MPHHHRHPSVASVSGPSFIEEPKISEEASPIVGSSTNGMAEQVYDSYSDDDDDLRDDEETGLTRKEKIKKQKRKRRNTQLDQRIAKEKTLSPDERKEVDKNIVKRIAVNVGLILMWYMFSLSISLVSLIWSLAVLLFLPEFLTNQASSITNGCSTRTD